MDDASAGAIHLADRIAVLSAVLPSRSLDRVLASLSEAGLAAVELAVGPGMSLETAREAEVCRARAALERVGLQACGVAAPASWPIGSPELETAVRIAADVGGQFVRAFAPPYDLSRPAAGQLADASSALQHLRIRTADLAVDLLLETAQGTVAPSPELASRVIRGADVEALGVVYDPANMVVEGGLQAEYTVSYLGPLLRHVHAKNQVFVRSNSGFHNRRTALDRGYVDWVDVGAALTRHDYAGFVSIDHLSGRPSIKRLRADVATLRTLLAQGTRRGAELAAGRATQGHAKGEADD
jgi:sugar phosphate isomerase/epimerase